MYLTVKVKNGRKYYYLRKTSLRNGRIISKDVAYLGSDPSKIIDKLKNLKQFEKDLKKSMRKITKTVNYERYLEKVIKLKIKNDEYIPKKELLDVEAAHLHFEEIRNKIDKLSLKEIYEEFSYEYTWHSSSIEGNTITLKGTTKFLSERILPKNKYEKELYDIRNGHDTFMYMILNYKKLTLNHKLVQEIHGRLVKDIDERIGYRLRPVRIHESNTKTTHPLFIKDEMNQLLEWNKKSKTNLHPLTRGAIFHAWFEKIHPFMDGNGRTGRILLNFEMLKAGYPPILINRKTRAFYISALTRSMKNNFPNISKENIKPILMYFLQEYKKNYWEYFE